MSHQDERVKIDFKEHLERQLCKCLRLHLYVILQLFTIVFILQRPYVHIIYLDLRQLITHTYNNSRSTNTYDYPTIASVTNSMNFEFIETNVL